MISGYQLFYILLVSRVVVTLTYFKSISAGNLSTDMLISFGIAYLLSLVFALPAYYCAVKYKNPLENKWVSLLYMLLFIYLAAANISRFAYFASSGVYPESSMTFVIILITAAVCYSAVLGIESLGRFSLFCGAVLFFVAAVVILANLKNINPVNYYPVFKNSRREIYENSLVFASNSLEPAVFLSLCTRVNGKKAKPLFFGITASYLLIFLIMFTCIGVMGGAGELYAFPVFTLFQLASVGTFSRLDMIHTAFWVFSLFLKSSVFIYCASVSVKRFRHSVKCAVLSVVSGAGAIVINQLTLKTNLTDKSIIISAAICFVFVVLIPIMFLIFGKKNKGAEVLERL